MDAGRLAFCHWDGKTFTTQNTAEPIIGEPRVFTDLGGDSGYRVIALEGTAAVWVSSRVILPPFK
jgi:hypothetical protein